MTVALALFVLSEPLQSDPPRAASFATAKANYWQASATAPSLSGSPLQNFASEQLRKIAQKALSDWLRETKKDQAGQKPRLTYTFDMKPTVSLNTKNLVSMYFIVSTFSAGAHPMYVYEPHTFGLVNGHPRRISAKDIFQSGANLVEVTSLPVLASLMHNDRAAWVQDGTVRELTKEQVESFVVTRSGLTYLFNPYDMGPYAVGSFQVKVPFAEMKGSLNPNGPLAPLLR